MLLALGNIVFIQGDVLMKMEKINKGWKFYKDVSDYANLDSEKGIIIDLPHTWNNFDGQDGGGDYYRGKCFYCKDLQIKMRKDKVYYLEFRGVFSIAQVYINEQIVTSHEGGFSTFRANITPFIKDGLNKLAVSADNTANDRVYPQIADFTFFGGIYRSVYLIETNKSHFDLDYYGSQGVMVTPEVLADGSAKITVKAYITNAKNCQSVQIAINYQEKEVAKKEISAKNGTAVFSIQKPNLWDGINDPCMYCAVVTLWENNKELDKRSIPFGIRKFAVDKDGFVLNGARYPLRGVCRHQDRLDMGWAITEKEHKEDMQLIAEVGANTIRLAHYQHDQYFYDLADQYGMVVWAEIPYISAHISQGAPNVASQMKELVAQNYHHPSICFWGLSNEITIAGESEGTYKLHKELNELCHSLDKTRLTTIANVTMLEPDSPLVNVADIMAYNHYFGWYIGDVGDNAIWIDAFRDKYPQKPLGISEYGCEAILSWHTSHPKQGDYSEEYQAYYHENMLKIFAKRPYLWGTYVWNMFDFGVDGRDEGGVAGRNNKGLVNYDRKIKKDSFYIYKAYWTVAPFVHITSKRYLNRAEKVTKVKVYSNQPTVALLVNGKEWETKQGKYIFEFEVPLKLFRKTSIVASSGTAKDKSIIKRVLRPDKGYILKVKESVANWFEKDGIRYEFQYPEGKFSIRDKLSAIMAHPQGEALVMSFIDEVLKGFGKDNEPPMKISKTMLKLVSGRTIENIAGLAGDRITQELLFKANEELNKISK